MDIYDFINSNDIKNYLREIKYKLSLIEKVYLINHSFYVELDDRLKFLKKLLKDKDEEVKPRRNLPKGIKSVHAFIKKYLKMHEKLNDIFFDNNGIYTYKVLYKNDNSYSDYEEIFSSFEKCFKEIKKDEDLEYFVITKKSLDSNKKIELTFNNKKKPLYYYSNYNITNLFEDLEALWLDIPTPFTKGDILYKNCRIWANNKNLVVLEFLSTWNGEEFKKKAFYQGEFTQEDYDRRNKHYQMLKEQGDDSDMDVVGFFLGDVCHVYTEVEFNYLDYEIYRGELDNDLRSLKIISDYMKEEIDLEYLLKTYRIIDLQKKASDEKWWYNADMLFDKYKL